MKNSKLSCFLFKIDHFLGGNLGKRREIRVVFWNKEKKVKESRGIFYVDFHVVLLCGVAFGTLILKTTKPVLWDMLVLRLFPHGLFKNTTRIMKWISTSKFFTSACLSKNKGTFQSIFQEDETHYEAHQISKLIKKYLEWR